MKEFAEKYKFDVALFEKIVEKYKQFKNIMIMKVKSNEILKDSKKVKK